MAAIALSKIRSDFTARKIRGLSIFSVGLPHGEKKVLEWEREGQLRK
jgi:hypothetical protein